ncbi:13786_t:CDS:10 [Ambispora leptoticha]|uniref:Centrosomal protein of 70 kDa n=1 Tax=Ambispora leptoticha TaxID=144679 RepID=A0A9N8ZRJ2_9GLOM|nr:13786_t:CDS:10 [Ambispora leptoticha]
MQKEKPNGNTDNFTRTTRSDTNHSFTFTEDGEKDRTTPEITPSLIVRPCLIGEINQREFDSVLASVDYHAPSHVYEPTVHTSPNDLSTLSVLSTTTNATEAVSVIENISVSDNIDGNRYNIGHNYNTIGNNIGSNFVRNNNNRIVQRIERSTQVTKIIMDNQTGNVDYSKLRKMIERSSGAENDPAVLSEKFSKPMLTKNNLMPEPSTNLQTQMHEDSELKIASTVKPQSSINDNNDFTKETTVTTMLKSAENNNAVPTFSINSPETIEDINENASQSQIYEELSNNLKELSRPILAHPDEQDSASISSNELQSKVQDIEYKKNIEPQIIVNEETIHDFKTKSDDENDDDAVVDIEDEGDIYNEDNVNIDNEDKGDINNEDNVSVDNEDEGDIYNEDNVNINNEDKGDINNEDNVSVDNEDEGDINNEDNVSVDNEDEGDIDNEDEGDIDNEDEDNVNHNKTETAYSSTEMQPKIQDTGKRTAETQTEEFMNYVQESTSLFLRNSNDYSLQDVEIKKTAEPQIDRKMIINLIVDLPQFAPLNHDIPIPPIINYRTEYDRDENIHNHTSEIEQLREENEKLKLELLAYKKNTRLHGISSRATKLDETRNNIKKDKLYYKLQLSRIDNLEETQLTELIKEIMLILKVDDMDQIVPSIEQIDKVVRLVPQLSDFINKVVDIVLCEQDEDDDPYRVKNYNKKANSAVGAGSSIPPEQKLCATIETILQWRDTVKEMEHMVSHLLQNTQKKWSKQKNNARR